MSATSCARRFALILGPAQRLIDDAGTMDLAERRESGQLVARNARMLLKHVNDLLDMSKLEARKLKIELQDTEVAALVRFLSSHFAVLAADRAIEYTVDADQACVAAVDPGKLQRVLMNLSDIMMPNVSGVEMIARMRDHPELRSTPVLVLSAKADEQLMVKLLDDGAQDFIVKPFSEKDLVVRVRNLILGVQAREETARSLAREQKSREEAEHQKQLLHSVFMQAPRGESDRDGEPAHRAANPYADGEGAEARSSRGRRRDSAEPGRLESPDERGEVHPARREHLRSRGAGR